MNARRGAAASLLFALIPLCALAEVSGEFPDWLPGVVAWSAALLLWFRLDGRQRRLVLALSVLGAAGIGWGLAQGQDGLVVKALTMNTPILAMLTGVAFLQLVSVAAAGSAARPPETGRYALARTMLGVHLFGAVINLSAALIAGDRLQRNGTLTRVQAMALGPPFSLSAFWSPFLGAMAVALTVARGADLLTLIALGVPLAALSLLLLWLWVGSARFGEARDFEGYPIEVGALWIPATLALGVLVAHELRPQWSVMVLIAVLSVAISAAVLGTRRGAGAAALLARHASERLPGMAGELWIFLAAAVLAAGVSALLAGAGIGAPFARFGGPEASLVAVLCTVLAWLGLHAVITIPLVGVLLAPLAPDPNLLACAFLISWALGLPACATSGTVLAMQARYAIPVATYIRWNLPFLAVMLGVSVVALHCYAWLLGAV
jgi:hypothetical protein